MTAYAVPPRVAFVIPEDPDAPRVFLMVLPDGSPVLLNDTAAVIWILAADGEPDVAGRVAETVQMGRQAVARDVDTFLADLVDWGLLTERVTSAS